MLLPDYIQMLQRKLEVLGPVRVAFTQGGYYADGVFADLHEDPQIEELKTQDEKWEWVWEDGFKTSRKVSDAVKGNFLVLGHSYQSY